MHIYIYIYIYRNWCPFCFMIVSLSVSVIIDYVLFLLRPKLVSCTACRPYRLEGTTLSDRLSVSHNCKHFWLKVGRP